MIDIFDLKVCDQHMMRVSWQVYNTCVLKHFSTEQFVYILFTIQSNHNHWINLLLSYKEISRFNEFPVAHTFLYIIEDSKKGTLKKLRKDQKTGIIHRHGKIKS